ncbi:hypothetical protein [Planosporangium mesophilum]|nr:hypothetical protein [Planosporangium mesophilum]NJC82915.1 hypothetical protein [Planosporangium mesophilum]
MSQASPRDDCYAMAMYPWNKSGRIQFDGVFSCMNYNQWNQARVSVEVYSNGGANYLGKTEHTCFSDLDGKMCYGDTATWTYSPGNWCTVVQVYIWPALMMFQDKSCKQI